MPPFVALRHPAGSFRNLATELATTAFLIAPKSLIGAPRFELGTPCTPCKCATRLRHAPNRLFLLKDHSHGGEPRGAPIIRQLPPRPGRRPRLQRRRIFIRSSSSTRICLTICWLW